MSKDKQATMEPRALTRGEARLAVKAGVFDFEDSARADEAMDTVLGMVFPGDDQREALDAMPNPECMALFQKIIAKTWAAPGEVKN